ncbi:MAG: UDP-N-acetylmuramoyl-tripeptide--D-alanyl-D-alanine ligase [Rhodothermales bacterium]
MLLFLTLLATLFAGLRGWHRLRYFLHLFQLEGYKPAEFGQWLAARMGQVFRRSHALAVVLLVLAFVWMDLPWVLGGVLLGWCVAFASSKLYHTARPKKPLKYTARMKRLTATSIVLALLPIVVGTSLGWAQGWPDALPYYLAGLLLADWGSPLWVLLAALLMKPVETSIQHGFKHQARTTLKRRSDLTVLTITGSYGKTSVKFIVAEILKQRYSVLATPGSYNTPMGICLVVNTMLKPEHQVLVLEMGIRHPGDMRELCKIAQPELGIVSNIGIAHLETMGSKENIAQEKGTMLEYLPPDGSMVLNQDDPLVAAMDARAPGRKAWRVSVDDAPDADITARDIRYGPEGARFIVRDETGTEHPFRTKLLGKHNVQNILLGVAVGRSMGLRLRQMAHAVRRIEPVAHRLALRQEGPLTVIDDAFNSNPTGAKNAVEILGQFEGTRAIVTPGMVELGERHYAENFALGQHIARHADLAVLVGEQQTAPIQDGLRDASYPEDQIKIFNSLFDARDYVNSHLPPGSVVLYENDLPDQYAE